MKLKFFLITIILFLNSCGYTPMYSSANKTNFYLEKINLKGDEFIINDITNNLNNLSQTNSKKIIIIEGKILYQKTSQTKNLAGDTTQYRLKTTSELTIKTSNQELKLNMNENFDMKNFDDEFEERNYEKTIKENFARSINSQIILRISKIE
tara:strand:- start:127 stop:582 length:456 start_codon:yes stop_codon:yes gene_type:complete